MKCRVLSVLLNAIVRSDFFPSIKYFLVSDAFLVKSGKSVVKFYLTISLVHCHSSS